MSLGVTIDYAATICDEFGGNILGPKSNLGSGKPAGVFRLKTGISVF